jgi:hypothetical protein
MTFIGIVFAYNIVTALLSAGPDPAVALLVVGKLLLVYYVPAVVLVFILPLRTIHTKMVSEGRLHESRYFTRTKALREEIQRCSRANRSRRPRPCKKN